MTGIFTGASLDEAKQKAADAFGVPVSMITVTVMDEPKRSLFGGLFGKKEECRIKAEYSPLASVVESEETETEPEQPDVQEEAVAEESAPETAAENTVEASEPETAPAEETETEVSPEIMLEKMQIAAAYLEQVLSALAPGVTAEGRIENGIFFELKGESAGSLIGRRGDTLDALQYLTSMIANRGDKDYVRVAIDTCGYRDKRRKALQDLAQRISRSVLRTGRSVALEPMNPYERRIIHSTVTDIEGVSSHSSGEEPNRKVIITSDSAPAYKPREEKNGRGYRNGGGRYDRNDRGRNRGGKRNDRGDRRNGEGPRKLDLSTSFEKDYKRPKPEDSLNTGVYGKIDI